TGIHPGSSPGQAFARKRSSLSPGLTALFSADLLWVSTDGEQIVRHRIKAGMHDLIVHREDKNRVEVLLHRRFQIRSGFAIDVPRLALRRSVKLRFERWHAKDCDARIGD